MVLTLKAALETAFEASPSSALKGRIFYHVTLGDVPGTVLSSLS